MARRGRSSPHPHQHHPHRHRRETWNFASVARETQRALKPSQGPKTMAPVDPYSHCPCGSDKKFKWCCQKVEAYAERGHRLEANGQHDAALAAYDEGLAKVPHNPWLFAKIGSPDRAAKAGRGQE